MYCSPSSTLRLLTREPSLPLADVKGYRSSVLTRRMLKQSSRWSPSVPGIIVSRSSASLLLTWPSDLYLLQFNAQAFRALYNNQDPGPVLRLSYHFSCFELGHTMIDILGYGDHQTLACSCWSRSATCSKQFCSTTNIWYVYIELVVQQAIHVR